MTTILDYGINNIRSISKALAFLGHPHVVRPEANGASRLILPGVGAFAEAMERLRPQAETIRSLAKEGVPILGICLGQQLLFETSREFGRTQGLEIVPGDVDYLPRDLGLKVPHMGWSEVSFASGCPLAQGVGHRTQFYFVHSLVCHCRQEEDVAATADFGGPFTAAVERSNVFGVQFHPEKSGAAGLQVLDNFLKWN